MSGEKNPRRIVIAQVPDMFAANDFNPRIIATHIEMLQMHELPGDPAEIFPHAADGGFDPGLIPIGEAVAKIESGSITDW